jgi:redox-sensitive bicupin YhaK (pirin superfamily)
MIKIRRSTERGQADHGWLKAKHSFSFGDYHDPQQMGFSALRVINEDRIAGGAGFPTHAHRDMEIITYIVDGVLEHKDSMGNTATISPGEVQRMSAGTGVRHSEYNHLADKKTHLLQIWILPDKANYPASYEQKNFAPALEKGELTLVASHNGREGSVSMNQDVEMYVAKSPTAGEKIINTDETRFYWVQVIKGNVKVNDDTLLEGDGLSASLLTRMHLQWKAGSEFLVFDLP